jgi:hypothetical protein
MKLSKLRPNDRVKVTWLDANSPAEQGWVDLDELKESDFEFRIESVGTVAAIDKNYISLVADQCVNPEFKNVVSRVVNIPVGCVQKVRRVREGK